MAPWPKLMGPTYLNYKTIVSKHMTGSYTGPSVLSQTARLVNGVKRHIWLYPWRSKAPDQQQKQPTGSTERRMVRVPPFIMVKTEQKQPTGSKKKMARVLPFIRVKTFCSVKRKAYASQKEHTCHGLRPRCSDVPAKQVAEDHAHVLLHMIRHPLLQLRSKAAADDQKQNLLRSF